MLRKRSKEAKYCKVGQPTVKHTYKTKLEEINNSLHGTLNSWFSMSRHKILKSKPIDERSQEIAVL